MSQHRCMGCMNLTENTVCEKCGWSVNSENEPHQLPVGTVLRGQYVIGRVLGQGGFGITYLCWDNFLEMPVAIKEYYPNALVTRDQGHSHTVRCYSEQAKPAYDSSLERFLREAKALTRLENEPAIVKIRNFFPENGTAYIVMEYIKGISLAKYVSVRGGKLNMDETLRILSSVMHALEKVHEAGLVHRDISPDNIILHPTDGAKLLDFGAVREVDAAMPDQPMLRSTEAILKHGFAPVEQYQNRGSLGPWTDVYALCGTVYYCLTGKILEDSPARMLNGTAIDWSDAVGITPGQIKTLEKGLALRAQERIQGVGELIAGLTEAKPAPQPRPVPEPVPEPPKPPKEPGSPRQDSAVRSRKPLWILLGCLVSVAILVLCYFTVHIWNGPTCEEDAVCAICGTQGDRRTGHDWIHATCTDAKYCDRCGEVSGDAKGHSWGGGSCTESRICQECGYSDGTPKGHDWVEATCTSPKTCRVCAEEEWPALGHSWVAATYTEPKTCKTCGLEEGDPRGFIRSMNGTWERFYSGSSYTSCLVFEKTVNKCRGFSLDVSATAVYGSVDGKWEIFYRTKDNVWVKLDTVTMKDGKIAAQFSFETPVEVNAVAAIINNNSNVQYNFSLTVYDLYYYE